MNKIYSLAYDIEVINSKRISAAIGVIFFILATTLGAYVRIPVKGSPVPITLQTFFVILSGAVLGKRLGLVSQLCYLALGITGLPIFQGYSSGLSVVGGPTGGYLAGFIFSSYLVGKLLELRNASRLWIIASFSLAALTIYAFGVFWLIYLYKISITGAISIGILPFIPGDTVKILLASSIYPTISKRSRKIF